MALSACCTPKPRPPRAAPPSATAPEPPSENQALEQFTLTERLENGFFLYSAVRPDGTRAHFYSSREIDAGPPRRVLLTISGSGCGSVFKRGPSGKISTGFPSYFERQAGDDYTILAMEKRGVLPFARRSDGGGGAPGCSEEYHSHATRDGRALEHELLLNAMGEMPAVDESYVVLVGHSEGTDVVAALGTRTGIRRVGYFSGGGPIQMYELVQLVRAFVAGKPPEEAEPAVAGFMNQLRDVQARPSSDRMLFGHPYKRWAGFFPHAPVEGLLEISVPIFLAHGSDDRSVPIESADFVEIEFIRHDKRNLTVRRYPGLDHNFWACSPSDQSCGKDNNKMPQVIRDFLSWSKSYEEAWETRL